MAISTGVYFGFQKDFFPACDAGYYGSDGTCTGCPDNTWSDAGTATVEGSLIVCLCLVFKEIPKCSLLVFCDS